MGDEPVILTSYNGPRRNVFDDVDCAQADAPDLSVGELSAKSFVLCFIERSGSTMLADLMEKTKVLGMPIECLNPRGPMWWVLQEYPAKSLGQYFDKLRRRSVTPNGVFGMKVAYVDFQPIVDSGLVNPLLGAPYFIYLTRKDIVLQAISYYVAEKRDLWHSFQRPWKAGRGLYPDRIEVEFDRDGILKLVDRIVKDQQSWENFFSSHGIEPLRVEYENLVPESISRELERICSFIGVEPSFSGADLSPSMEIMRNSRNEEWAERIRNG